MYLAVDIGGTKTLVASLDDNGVIQQKLKFPTAKDYKVFIRKLEDTVAYLSTKEFIAAGVAAPGRIDRKRGIGIGMGNLPWVNVPIRDDVSRIAKAPAVIDNDAKLAGLSEAMLLKDSYNKVLYLTLGTGIGCAIITNQKIDPSLADMEGGKILLEHQGMLQEWERFAGGKAITEHFGKPASELTNPKDWEYVADNLTIGLIDILAICQPEVVIVGGGMGAHFDKFKQPLLANLAKYETPLIPVPPVIQARRPDDAVVFGCYDLARQAHGPTNS